MPMPGGRRHWPEKSGYFDSSNAPAPEIGSDSAPARASVAVALRFIILALPMVLNERVRTSAHADSASVRPDSKPASLLLGAPLMGNDDRVAVLVFDFVD